LGKYENEWSNLVNILIEDIYGSRWWLNEELFHFANDELSHRLLNHLISEDFDQNEFVEVAKILLIISRYWSLIRIWDTLPLFPLGPVIANMLSDALELAR
jgi:hypothetical protein